MIQILNKIVRATPLKEAVNSLTSAPKGNIKNQRLNNVNNSTHIFSIPNSKVKTSVNNNGRHPGKQGRMHSLSQVKNHGIKSSRPYASPDENIIGLRYFSLSLAQESIKAGIKSLDLVNKGVKDLEQGRQSLDALLSSDYSDASDRIRSQKLTNENKYLEEMGLLAKNAGLKGGNQKDIFIPTGAGANAFITPLLSPLIKGHPHFIQNSDHKLQLASYAKKLLSDEGAKLSQKIEKILKDPSSSLHQDNELKAALQKLVTHYPNFKNKMAEISTKPKV